ncbi:sulfatase [Bacillus toyonensis]|uniref:septation protein SpoVG family protein n=1 Tax=Bacillus toyonensis TaxID=155322 RepID=UPI000BFE9A6F|nr:septation protein SpoVG family protein [Bacillus toyonensis]PHE64376.1 sulfatase [Bacillus toyonensis]
MNIEVTDVSFSLAKTVNKGSCGFCRVIINDCIAINRVRVSKEEGNLKVLLPRKDWGSDGKAGVKPIVQLLNEETIQQVTSTVINEYNRLIKVHNGFYSREHSKSKRTYV